MSETDVLVKCKNCPDDFCYVRGEYSHSEKLKKPIGRAHERAYLAYFGFNISNQTKHWAPHFICRNCHLGLLNFSKPMCWHGPKNHTTTGTVLEYANVISVTKPISNQTVPPHTPEFVKNIYHQS